MQDRGLKPPEDVLACSRPLMDRRLKPQNDQVLKCPRCESLNTKFCYYNNYSLLQPRHFCKNCRRYWTKGGALRNVPVGGGCRKNKRTKQRPPEQALSTSHHNGGEGSGCPHLPESLSGAAPSSLYYTVSAPMEGDEISFSYNRSQQQQHQEPALRLSDQSGLATSTSRLFGGSHLASLPSSTLASLSNHLSNLGALPVRTGFLGLDFNAPIRSEHGGNLAPAAGELNAFLETHPHLAVSTASTSNVLHEGATAFSLALDSFHAADQEGQWKAQQQHHQHKLALQSTRHHEVQQQQQQGLIPFENHSVEAMRHHPQLRPGLASLSPCRKLEETRPPDWHGTQEGIFDASTVEVNYWNNGTWPDLSGYGPSASPLL